MRNSIPAFFPFFPAFVLLFLRDENEKHGFFSRKNSRSSGLCTLRGVCPKAASGGFPDRSRLLRPPQYGHRHARPGRPDGRQEIRTPYPVQLFHLHLLSPFQSPKSLSVCPAAGSLRGRNGRSDRVRTCISAGYLPYFLCRFLPYPTLADAKELDEDEKRQLGEDFIAFTVSLHRHRLLPGDYNPGNILYHKDPDGKYRFALVDINRFHFGKAAMSHCMRSFTQLSGVRLSQLAALIRRYCDVRHWNLKRAWKYFLFYRRSLCRKERIKSKFKSLLGLLP